MEFKPTAIEMEKVSALLPFDRYQYTIKKVADFEQSYTLVRKDGTTALAEAGSKPLLSIQLCRKQCSGEWQNCQVKNMALEQLLLAELDAFLINVFSVNGKIGFVVSATELRRDLEEELEQY